MMTCWCLFTCHVFITVLFTSVCAFNSDIRTAVVHRGPPDSMFGFSVSLLKDKDRRWALIGAPKSHTNQPNVTRGGAVFLCPADSSSGCVDIPFDSKGPNFEYDSRSVLHQTDDKSNQWFGASLDSSTSSDGAFVVACAPRYVYFSVNYQRREPVGTCWMTKDSFKTFEEYSPCRTAGGWGVHRQGYCQAGMSVAVTEDSKRLFVGSPGSFYWQGQVFSRNLISIDEDHYTRESPVQYDDSFLGYSSAVGEFTGDKNMDVAIGMPRGNNLTGKVVLLNSTLHNLLNITGEQLGSYFGYTICVSDVNGDGLDDIVVGAPLYTNFDSKESRYEEGRVYVIYQDYEHKFKSMNYLDGEHTKGRFGLSLASLDDINQDGFQDFAVGAPYAGIDSKGIVYIFHGSPSGVRDKPSQLITPDDFPSLELNTLGFSVSGGIDIDDNDYPDILIGAYGTDQTILMRSRPVVNLTSTMKLSSDVISLENKRCMLKDKAKVACVEATLCLFYNGLGVDSELDIIYNVTVDSNLKNSRALFLQHDNSYLVHALRLRKNVRYCNTSVVYIQNGIRDKLTPIMMQANYELVDHEPYRHILKPVLNENVPSSASKELNIEKNCGKDDICIPDLQLFASANMDQYSIGSRKRLEIEVTVHNAGEDAFESLLYVSMPLDVNYVNIEKKKHDFPVSCTGAQPEKTGENELICDIGNPLPANKTLSFKILLAPSRVVSSVTDLIFFLVANSTNAEKEETMHNNEEIIELPVRVEVSIAVRGISNPTTITYNKSEELEPEKQRETDIGPEITHIYEVGNKGPSSIREAEVHILWPTYNLERKPLLYLMSQPDIKGSAQCDSVEDVNPMRIQEVRRKQREKHHVSVQEMKSFSRLTHYPSRNLQIIRKKREFPLSDEGEEDRYFGNDEETSFNDELSCGPTLCTHIRCTITNLEKNEQVIFSIRSRLWRETYNEFGLNEVQTSSKLVTRITTLPYGVDPSYLPYKIYTVSTKVILEDVRSQPYIIPWWIIILAVCCGLLLLALLALLLWKLGFFKRKRPDEQPEKELLNDRNGYHMTSGDAAL